MDHDSELAILLYEPTIRFVQQQHGLRVCGDLGSPRHFEVGKQWVILRIGVQGVNAIPT